MVRYSALAIITCKIRGVVVNLVPFWPVNPGENPVAVPLPDQGVLLTVNDFLIKAAALTMEVSKKFSLIPGPSSTPVLIWSLTVSKTDIVLQDHRRPTAVLCSLLGSSFKLLTVP